MSGNEGLQAALCYQNCEELHVLVCEPSLSKALPSSRIVCDELVSILARQTLMLLLLEADRINALVGTLASTFLQHSCTCVQSWLSLG